MDDMSPEERMRAYTLQPREQSADEIADEIRAGYARRIAQGIRDAWTPAETDPKSKFRVGGSHPGIYAADAEAEAAAQAEAEAAAQAGDGNALASEAKSQELARQQMAMQRMGGQADQGPSLAQQRGDQAMQMLMAPPQYRSGANPRRPMVEEYANTQRSALNMGYESSADLMAMQQVQQQQEAQLWEENAIQERQELVAMQARESTRQEWIDEATKDQKAAMAAYDEMHQKVMSAPDIDPGRYWSDKPAILGILAMFGTGLLAASGDPDPMRNINIAIDRDIDAQKANLMRNERGLSYARERVAMSDNLYAQTMTMVKDDRIAKKMIRMARYEELTARLKSMTAGYAATQLPVQHNVMLAGMQQAYAKEKLEVENLLVSTPRTITQGGSALTKDQRWLAQEMVKQGGKMDLKMFDAKMASAVKDNEVPPEWRGTYHNAKHMEESGRRIRGIVNSESYVRLNKLRTSVADLNSFISGQDDIAGYYSPFEGLTEGTTHSLGDSARALQQRIKLVADDLGRERSGAAITQSEREAFVDMLMGSRSETQFRYNIQLIQDQVDAKINSMLRHFSPGEKTIIEGMDMAPLPQDPRRMLQGEYGENLPGSFREE